MTTSLRDPAETPRADGQGGPPGLQTAAPTVTRLPDFLIIGAAKCGTTTLHQYLARHPQVGMPRKKEPEFFADKFHRGFGWYCGNFAHAQPGQVCGEASPIYTWWQEYPLCAARIGHYLPHAKLIYLVRHPVARTYSQYLEQIKTHLALGRSKPHMASFADFVAHYEHFVAASEYIRYIEEYEQYFPREALLCLLLDDLKRDPTAVLEQVCRHIGVAYDPAMQAAGAVHAKRTTDFVDWQRRLYLTAWLRAIPGAETLAGYVPRSLRNLGYRLLEHTRAARRAAAAVAPPMLPETRARLIERFRAPNRRLAEYLRRDLSRWNE